MQSDGRVAGSDVGAIIAPFLAKIASVWVNIARNWASVAAGVAADVSRLCCRVLSVSVSNGVALLPLAVVTRVRALSYRRSDVFVGCCMGRFGTGGMLSSGIAPPTTGSQRMLLGIDGMGCEACQLHVRTAIGKSPSDEPPTQTT